MMSKSKYEYIRANVEARVIGMLIGVGAIVLGGIIMKASFDWSAFGSFGLFVGGVFLWVALFYNDPKVYTKKKRRGR